MSYQPNSSPGVSTPPPPPPPVSSAAVTGGWGAAPPPAAMSTAPARRRGRWMVWLGVLVLVVSVAAGVTCLVLSTSAVDNTVAEFARAPQGCTTTLAFDHAGTFTLYFEQRGHVHDVGGDCDMNESSYDFLGDRPDVSMSLVGSDGTAVAIDSLRGGGSYDTEHYAGVPIGRVHVDQAGDYDLSVSADAGVFAVAVGGDPKSDQQVLLGVGIIVLAVGVALGVVLLLMGRQRGRRARSAGPGGQMGERPVLPVVTYQPTIATPRPTLPVVPPAGQPSGPPTWGPPTA